MGRFFNCVVITFGQNEFFQTTVDGVSRLGGEQECGGQEDQAGGKNEKEKGEESSSAVILKRGNKLICIHLYVHYTLNQQESSSQKQEQLKKINTLNTVEQVVVELCCTFVDQKQYANERQQPGLG